MKKAIILAWTIFLCLTFCGCDSIDYKKAAELYDNGEYEKAALIFEELGTYEDSEERGKESRYQLAYQYYEAGDYDEALEILAELEDYSAAIELSKQCKYDKASKLLSNGNYEEAMALFSELSDYSDAEAMYVNAKKLLQKEKYGDVIALLTKDMWFYEAASVNTLNVLTFTDDKAVLSSVYFTENGKGKSADNTVEYEIDDNKLTILTNNPVEIAYTLKNGEITLDKSKYFSTKQIESALQGYWTVRESFYLFGMYSASEYNFYINNGTIVSESASTSAYGDGYFYYGPDTGRYTLNAGGFNTNVQEGDFLYFSIENGKVVLLHFDNVCSKSTKGLPGEDGYQFN